MKYFIKFFTHPVFNVLWFIIFNLFYIVFAFAISSLGFWDFGRGISFPLLFLLNLNIVIPILCVILFFRNNNNYTVNYNIYNIFWGIEIPVIALISLRVCLLSDITPFFVFLLTAVTLAILVQIIDYADIKPFKKTKVMAFGFEIAVILGIYALILSSFFILPVFFDLIKMICTNFIPYIFSFKWLFEITETFTNIRFLEAMLLNLPMYIIYFLFFAFFGILFVAIFITPFISLYIYFKNFIKYGRECLNKKIFIIFAVVFIAVTGILAHQPNYAKVESAIEKFQNANVYEQRAEIAKKYVLNNERMFKSAILNRYLAKYRYFEDINYNGIAKNYKNKKTGILIQNIFNFFAGPFLFNGTFNAQKANFDYQILFDSNIQFAFKDKIRKAVYSTLFGSETAATLLDSDAKDVLLVNRKTDIHCKEGIAVVGVEEEYKNQSTTDKEVYYQFYLPQGSVITDLKLGDKLQFQGKISPKGAARKTYERQVVNFKDPSLLEKSGLNQYTLRVFPIPVKNTQKIRYEYLTLVHNNRIELPNIYERRNVYENFNTKKTFILNDNILQNIKDNSYISVNQKVSLPQNVKIGSNYYSLIENSQKYDVKNKKIAILLDTSFSNKTNWKNFLIKDEAYSDLTKNNTVEIYYFNDLISEKIDINTAQQINIGQTKKINAINKMGDNYDIIVVLTDGSQFDVSDEKTVNTKIPVYIIHADGKIPPYDNTLTIGIIKSRGDIEKNIKDVLIDYFAKQDKDVLSVTEEYIVKKCGNSDFSNNENLKKIITAQVIKDIIRKENINETKVLDYIHKLAKDNKIVTQYSSYIALVDKNQQKLLEYNEKSEDRYIADKKTGADRFVDDKIFDEVKAVPEPKEQIMLIIGILLIISVLLKRKFLCKK